MKLIYYNILKLKKTENTKSILIISPIACFKELSVFLLKTSPPVISPSKTPYENVWVHGLQ